MSFAFDKKIFFAVAVLVLVFGVWFYQSRYFPFGGNRNNFEITFSPKWLNQSQFAGFFVAKDLGIYGKYGLDVNIKEFKVGGSVLDDLKSGKSQMGLMSANEFLSYYSKGEQIKAVAVFYQISPFLIASKKNLGIESPVDLKGKRLGIKGGAGAEGQLVYDLLLKSAGLSPEDAIYVELPFGTSEAEDLLADKVDAIGFYRTQMSDFINKDVSFNFIYPEKYGAALYNDVLVVKKDFLESNPRVVKNFIKATKEGWVYAYKHKEKAVAVTMRYVTDRQFKGIDFERDILTRSENLMIPDGNINALGHMEEGDWIRFYNALLARGFIESQFDVGDAFSVDFLK